MQVQAERVQAAKTDLDPFGEDILSDPYDFHEHLREAGPVVWVERYGVWAVARYAEVKETLSDWQTFVSTAGVGIVNTERVEAELAPGVRLPGLLLDAAPAVHARTRTVLTRILSPAGIRRLRESFEAVAVVMIDDILSRGQFDGIKDLAEPYALKVFLDAIGLREEGRENFLPYGAMVFNSLGPRNHLYNQSIPNAEYLVKWMASCCSREALVPGGMGSEIFDAADAGEISEDEASMLLRSFLSAGMDTTINAIGNTLYCLAENPDQYKMLCADTSLIRQAFDEALRFESPVQAFFRTAGKSVTMGGADIAEGDKIMALLGAANRDPRQWENPDRFEVSRRATGHMAFGTGMHGCVGQAISRMEADAILSVLARKVSAIEKRGIATRRLNNTLRALDRLPLSVVPA